MTHTWVQIPTHGWSCSSNKVSESAVIATHDNHLSLGIGWFHECSAA